MPKRKHAPSKPEEEEQAAAQASDSDDDFPSADEDGSPPTSEDDEDGAAFNSIDVSFDCVTPEEEDFHGLKTLLTNLLDGKQYACSELVEAVIAAPAAAVIKCGEGEDPIGVAAVLPLAAHKGLEALEELRAFVKERAPKGSAAAAAVDAAWDDPGAALLISERLLNSPPQLAPPLMESLMADVEAAGHAVTQYIFVTRAYADPTVAGAAQGAKKGKKKKASGENVVALIFATPEGEFLAAHAAATAFSFAVPNRAVGKDDLVPRRVAAVVPAAEVPAALAEMTDVVGGGGGGGE
jgi:protein BCP1